MEINIKKLDANDWEKFKNISEESYTEYPEAFGGSVDEFVDMGKDYWVEKINADYSNDNVTWRFACLDVEVVGLCGIYKSPRPKLIHTGSIFDMYVKKEFQGKGIAGLLMNEMIKLAKDNNQDIVKFEVTEGNDRAIKFYEKMGFKQYGVSSKTIKIGSKFFNTVLMEREINKTT